MIKQVILSLQLFFFTSFIAFAQLTIQGNITDEQGGHIGESYVFINDMLLGTSTNDMGQYSLHIPSENMDGKSVEITARSMGYHIERKNIFLINGYRKHNFQLRKKPNHDDEILNDYAYNLLQSVKKDAILFVNDDFDMFWIWYLQEVMGIRTDVRVVNLSLLNTPWYIKQLKNLRPHGAKSVPISLTDSQIEQIRPMQFEPRKLELPVPEHVYDTFGVDDPEIRAQGKIRWLMINTGEFSNIPIIRVQDFMVRDIVMTSGWDRPVYFAVTIPDYDSKIGLDEYLRLDGLVQRITPIREERRRQLGIEELYKNLFDEPETFSREPQYGYKFRGLNDPSVYLEEQSRRLTVNYKNVFLQLAMHYHHDEGNDDLTIQTLDRMEYAMPRDHIDMSPGMKYEVAGLYRLAGKEEKYSEITAELIEEMKALIDESERPPLTMNNPYIFLYNIYREQQEFEKERDILLRMQMIYSEEPDVVRFAQQRVEQLNNIIKSQEK